MLRGQTVAIVLVAASVAAAGEADKAGQAAFTLGLVQKELRTGLSQAEVVERLGAPNLLTRDAHGREAWVYDRVASEVESSSASVGIGGALQGGGSSVAGLLGIGAGQRTAKARSCQRTLTVVVRFDDAGRVATFSWRDSRF